MAIRGKHGGLVSYDCEELIRELRMDIAEFGEDEFFVVWMKSYPEHGVELAVNYDFIEDEKPIDKDREVGKNERLVIMKADVLLDRFIKQNDIFNAYDLGDM